MGKIKNFEYYDNLEIDMLRVKLITGTIAVVKTKTLVGFCCHEKYRGFLTNKLIKSHQCFEKGCPFLKKYEDFPYWQNRLRHRKTKDEYIKQKQESLANRKSEKEKNAMMLSYIREKTEREDLPIYVTSIYTTAKSSYCINYVSFERRNDWQDFFSLAIDMSNLFNGRFKVKHIKTLNGDYATIDDYFSSQGYHSR